LGRASIFFLLVLFQILPEFELRLKFKLKFKLNFEFEFKFLRIYFKSCLNSNSSLSLNSFFLNLFQILPEFKLKFKFKFKISQIYSKFKSQVGPAILPYWFYSNSCTNSNSSSILNSVHMSPWIHMSGWAQMSTWPTALVVLVVKKRVLGDSNRRPQLIRVD
jgi:hypothetical protein